MQLEIDDRLLQPSDAERQFVKLSRNDETITITAAPELRQGTHQLVQVAGRPFLCHLSERDQVVSQALARWRHWELLESVLLAAILRPGMTVIDAGANVGYYTRLFAQAVGPRGVVVAFEPEPNNYLVSGANALLTARVCPTAGRIQLQNEALGAARGTIALALYPKNLGYHSVHVREGWMHSTIEVPLTTLDRHRFGDDGLTASITAPVDLIKADIQGAELDLVQGARRTLETDHPLLCLEYEPEVTGRQRASDLLGALQELGYNAFRVFHANENNPSRMLSELCTWLEPQEIRERVAAGSIRSYGTLWAARSES